MKALRGVTGALGYYLDYSPSELSECRYHYGRTGSLMIYVVGNDYYTACRSTRTAPPKCHDNDYNFDWQLEMKDFFGWDIYKFSPN